MKSEAAGPWEQPLQAPLLSPTAAPHSSEPQKNSLNTNPKGETYLRHRASHHQRHHRGAAHAIRSFPTGPTGAIAILLLIFLRILLKKKSTSNAQAMLLAFFRRPF